MKEPVLAVAMAGLQASLYGLMVSALNGLVSPADANRYLDSVARTLEKMPGFSDTALAPTFDELCAEIRLAADENWKGE